MYSYKFYSFLLFPQGSKSQKMGEILIKKLIINKRFYLFTEIFRRSTRIETFNRLPTKIENFNRLPTKLLNFNRQPASGPPHSDPLPHFQSYIQLLDKDNLTKTHFHIPNFHTSRVNRKRQWRHISTLPKLATKSTRFYVYRTLQCFHVNAYICLYYDYCDMHLSQINDDVTLLPIPF